MAKLKTLINNKTKLVLLISVILNLLFFSKLLFPSFPSYPAPSSPPSLILPSSAEAHVLRIIDGDTFDIEGDIRVRIAGADAPEQESDCLAAEATARLDKLINGKDVQLKEIAIDNNGRYLAFVFLDDLFIDKTVIEEGYAEAQNTRHPQYGVFLAGAEDRAINAGRGIWSDKCKASPTPGCNIKGNVTSTSGKSYHLPGCYNYDKIVIRSKEGDRWFCSEVEATASGFRKSHDCPN